jgi:hypothetical protein
MDCPAIRHINAEQANTNADAAIPVKLKLKSDMAMANIAKTKDRIARTVNAIRCSSFKGLESGLLLACIPFLFGHTEWVYAIDTLLFKFLAGLTDCGIRCKSFFCIDSVTVPTELFVVSAGIFHVTIAR